MTSQTSQVKAPKVFQGLIVLLSAILSVWLVFGPLLASFDLSTTSVDDGALIAWQIQQVKLALMGKAELYHQPFFSPYQNTLTYSEPMISSGGLAVLTDFWQLTPIEQLNLQLIMGSLTCFLASYLLIFLSTKKFWPALFGASFFTFSLLRFQYVVHLHTYLIFGVPLVIFDWQRYLQTNQSRYLVLIAGGFLFQALNNPLTAYALGLIFLAFLLEPKSRQVFFHDRLIWLIGGVTLLICGLFYWPYIQTVQQFGVPFTIRDAAHFSFSLNYLLTFDVLLPVISIIFLVGFNWRRWRQFISQHKVWWLISLLGLVCMLGPVAKWQDQTLRFFGLPIPLPYAVLYYVLPGIQSIRSVTRFSILLALGLAVLLSQALIFSERKAWQKYLLAIGLVIWLLVGARRFMPVYPIVTQPPAIYTLVKHQTEKTLAILPLYLWPMRPYVSEENKRLLFQLDHGKILYNGTSGFMPPQRVNDITTHWQAFPNDQSMALFKAAKIDLLLVQYGQYQDLSDAEYELNGIRALQPSQIEQQLAKRNDIQLIGCIQSDCLYKITD